MKKPLKILYVVLSAIVVVLIVVVVAIHLFADSALKIGIETAGTKALSVAVNVDDVDLSILGGSLGFKNLVIDNPPGYQHDTLLEVANARVAVDIRSLLSDTVNIKQIKLDGINVVLEQRGISSNNLHDVIKAIPKTEPKPDEPTAQPAGKKLRVDELEITNVTVKAKLLPVPGKADTVTLKLKPIRMTDLGTDNKLDTAKLSGKILLAIATGVAEQGAGLLPDDMTSAMKDTLGKTVELGKTAAEEGKKILEEGKGVLDGLKGLLKKKE